MNRTKILRFFLGLLVLFLPAQFLLHRHWEAVTERHHTQGPCADPISPGSKIEVVVIGAGMAGLTAAAQLARAGFQVALVEARDRIGGRTHTATEFSAPVDLGASWIHGTNGNPLTKLARELGSPWQCTNESNNLYVNASNSEEFDDTFLREWEFHYNGVLTALGRHCNLLKSNNSDASIAAALQRAFSDAKTPRKWQFRVWFKLQELVLGGGGLQGGYGADAEELSCAYYDDQKWYPGCDGYLLRGYRTITSGLADTVLRGGGRLILGSPVTRLELIGTIRPRRCAVSIHLGGRSAGKILVASHVIVAVPLGILKHRSLQFVPPLPVNLRQAIQRLGVGNLEKVVMEYPEGIALPNSEYLYAVDDSLGADELRLADIKAQVQNDEVDLEESSSGESDEEWEGDSEHLFSFDWFADTLNVYPYARKPIVVIFIYGRFARFIRSANLTFAKSVFVSHLRTIIPSLPDPIRFMITNWSDDPYSRGSLSFQKVGSTPADYRLFEEMYWDRRLVFAGEHASRDFPTTVHGAHVSGLRAAAQVMGSHSL